MTEFCTEARQRVLYHYLDLRRTNVSLSLQNFDDFVFLRFHGLMCLLCVSHCVINSFVLHMSWRNFPGNRNQLFWETKDDMSTICILPFKKMLSSIPNAQPPFSTAFSVLRFYRSRWLEAGWSDILRKQPNLGHIVRGKPLIPRLVGGTSLARPGQSVPTRQPAADFWSLNNLN